MRRLTSCPLNIPSPELACWFYTHTQPPDANAWRRSSSLGFQTSRKIKPQDAAKLVLDKAENEIPGSWFEGAQDKTKIYGVVVVAYDPKYKRFKKEKHKSDPTASLGALMIKVLNSDEPGDETAYAITLGEFALFRGQMEARQAAAEALQIQADARHLVRQSTKSPR